MTGLLGRMRGQIALDDPPRCGRDVHSGAYVYGHTVRQAAVNLFGPSVHLAYRLDLDGHNVVDLYLAGKGRAHLTATWRLL